MFLATLVGRRPHLLPVIRWEGAWERGRWGWWEMGGGGWEGVILQSWADKGGNVMGKWPARPECPVMLESAVKREREGSQGLFSNLLISSKRWNENWRESDREAEGSQSRFTQFLCEVRGKDSWAPLIKIVEFYFTAAALKSFWKYIWWLWRKREV